MSEALDSFRRIRGNFLVDRFYEHFLAADERIRVMFAHTDFMRQKQMLLFGLLVILGHSSGDATVSRALKRIGEQHRKLGLSPEMYDTFVSCLLRSAAELDPQWNHSVEQSWRSALNAGIELMRR